MIKTLALLLFLSSTAAHGATLKSWQNNRAGVKDYNAKNWYGANQNFVKALEDDPLNPEVQLNLGLTYEANEEWDKAAAAYKGVLQLVPPNSALYFEAMFNLAGAYSHLQKIDQALEAYQACLEIKPDSLETKNNIELLWQGGGGGGGNGQDKDQKQQKEDQKDGRSNQEKREQAGPEPEQKPKQPKPFQSQEMNQQDVKRILDEIKNQEQAIRANEYDKSAKEAPRGKDW